LPKEENSSAIESSAKLPSEISNNLNILNTPRKPPRMNPSVSDSQLCRMKNDTKHSTEKNPNDSIANRKRNPVLPRKPPCLRKSTGAEELPNSTFYIDSPESESNGDSGNITGKTQSSTSPERNCHSHEKSMHISSSDSQLGRLPKSNSCLKPNNVSNVGCTPPLPRKPVRMHSPASRDSAEGTRNDVGYNRGGRLSLPNERVSSIPFQIQTDIKCDDQEMKPPKLPDKAASNIKRRENDNEQITSPRQVVKQASTERLSQPNPPPHRPPPPPKHQGPSRRPPPGLPKRPSLEGKRKSGPPPLPSAPRPVSIARENALKPVRNFRRRSHSEGDIIDVVHDEGNS
jgi:hypothetical protein